MNDLTDLRDAFTELERRADAHPQTDLAVRPVPASAVDRTRRAGRAAARRPVLIGATVAALLAAVAGTVVATTGPGDTSAPAASPSSATTELASSGAPSDAPSATPSPTGDPVRVATTTAELADRFTAALGGLATFTVTSTNDPQPGSTPPASSGAPSGAPSVPSSGAPSAPTTAYPIEDDVHDVAIIGVLTAGGVSGGYDVQTLQTTFGPATCAEESHCTVTTLADGSSLAVGTATTLLAADGSADGGLTHEVVLVRTDGVEVILHVSNQRDPKGMSEVLAPQPPLTTAQMTTIVTSPRWVVG